MTSDGFIQRYGNGETALTFNESLFRMCNGEKRLIFDDGSMETVYYSPPSGIRPEDKFEKYRSYGVRKIIKKYTYDEIYLGIAKHIE